MKQQVESVANRLIRPLLQAHGGDLRILEVCDGVARFELLGSCAGCPASDLTGEALVREVLLKEFPALHDVVLVRSCSPELLAQARAILNRNRDA